MSLAQAVAQAAPWWGVPLLAGLFTVLGVLIAQLMSWTSDRRKAKREDRQRWFVDKRQSYTAYLMAATKLRLRLYESWDEKLAEDVTDKLIEEVNDRRQELALIATAEVVSAADDVFEQILEFVHGHYYSNEGVQERATQSDALNQQIANLRQAARSDLGLA